MPGENQPPPNKPRNLFVVMMAIFGVGILVLMFLQSPHYETRSWTAFEEDLSSNKVIKVVMHSQYIIYTKPTDGKKAPEYRVDYLGGFPQDTQTNELRQKVEDYNSRIRADNLNGKPFGHTIELVGVPPPSVFESLWPQLLLLVAFIVGLYFLVFRRMGQGGGVLSFGKSRAVLVTKGKTAKTFKDVAGIDEAKDEVEELVDFLRHPKKFQKLGGRIPKGVMLVGPPGTGKTLLAKAIAGEADVPFYSISGSDFVEMFVGVGASRVRDLFNQAKENSPCIIFIDEIDAVGRRRGSGTNSGGHDEREQTLNAILVEMDGFASTDKVIVIAATNRVDVLDPALLRPGRFDRHIYVNLPDIAGREQILQVHAGKVKLGAQVDLIKIARGTPGFSGADLESLINEAALHAARGDKEVVGTVDLEYARDRVAFGRERKAGSRAMPEDERRITAYHEAGHAILQLLIDDTDDLHKVTIIPRGRALGATMHLPTQDRHTHGRRKLLSEMCVLFGGRVAEDLFCGDVTTGATNDIERATRIARGMVYEWGMSEKMGPLKYTEDHDSAFGHESTVSAGVETRRELDQEVRRLIDEQYKRALDTITTHREALERIALTLLDHETLDGDQVRRLVDGETLPPRQPTVTIRKEEPTPEVAPKSDDDEGLTDLKPSLA
jgi:cell division protease FtsH